MGHDEDIARLVSVIESMLDSRVLCIIAVDERGVPYTVCPLEARHRVMRILADIDWKQTRADVLREEEGS